MRFLIRVFVIFVLVMAAVSAIRKLLAPMFDQTRSSASNAGPDRRGRQQKSAGRLVADPVCGTYIAAASAPSLQQGDETFYFCSEECRTRFRETA